MRARIFVPMLGVLAPALAQPAASRPDTLAATIENRVIDWRRDIHANPELGFMEERTSALVAAHLQKLGLEVRTKIARTGVVGILKGGKPGPLIAFRADMDALPIKEENSLPVASKAMANWEGKLTGVMHACGHDAHTAILMGVAETLAGMREELAGSVMFIFQPAEEGSNLYSGAFGGGAKPMIDEGLFKDGLPSAIYGLHVVTRLPVGKVGFRAAAMSASTDNFKIVVNGKGTHGASPWLGVDPIVVSAQIINALQTISSRITNVTDSPVVVTVGAINGGNRENIIPDRVDMIGTIRALSDAQQKAAHEALQRIAKSTAEAAGATAEVSIEIGYPVNNNEAGLTERSGRVLQSLLGAGNIVRLPSANMSAEDFAFYGRQAPAFFFSVGVAPRGLPPQSIFANHSPKFMLDEAGLATGIKATLALAFEQLGVK